MGKTGAIDRGSLSAAFLPLARALELIPLRSRRRELSTFPCFLPMPLRLPQAAASDLARGLAIETRFLGPTNHRGSRISAVCRRDSDTVFRATVSYSYEGSPLDCHHKAALACLMKIEAQNDHFSFRFQCCSATDRGYLFITETVAR